MRLAAGPLPQRAAVPGWQRRWRTWGMHTRLLTIAAASRRDKWESRDGGRHASHSAEAPAKVQLLHHLKKERYVAPEECGKLWGAFTLLWTTGRGRSVLECCAISPPKGGVPSPSEKTYQDILLVGSWLTPRNSHTGMVKSFGIPLLLRFHVFWRLLWIIRVNDTRKLCWPHYLVSNAQMLHLPWWQVVLRIINNMNVILSHKTIIIRTVYWNNRF